MKVRELQERISARQKDLNPTINHTEMVESAERSIFKSKEAAKTSQSEANTHLIHAICKLFNALDMAYCDIETEFQIEYDKVCDKFNLPLHKINP